MSQNKVRKPHRYWTEETTIIELELIIKELGHFPTNAELLRTGRSDLINAIRKHGGYPKFRTKVGSKLIKKPNNYWNDEVIIMELEPLIKELDHFPTQTELCEMDNCNLNTAISRHGGINKFRELMGYYLLKKPNGYWNDNIIIIELKPIIEKLGHFPTYIDLINNKKTKLSTAISKNGGHNKFRRLLGYEVIMKRNYWSEEIIISKLEYIINKLGHFPTHNELINMNKHDLSGAIQTHGGMSHFWEIFKITPSEIQRKQSVEASYFNNRGLNSEKIVKELIIKWCSAHNLPQPEFDVKLAKGNVIEFVCELNSKIGIDVTNTKNKGGQAIKHKWKKKEYHLHLDELWIVVFSDVYNDHDYIKFNKESPDNIKVMSINTFMEELQISVDNNLQLKIEDYNTCNFHNKDDFSHPKLGLSKFFKIKPDIRIKN